MGIEPTQPAWKAGILAIELHPHAAFHRSKLVTLTIIAEYTLFVNTFFDFFPILSTMMKKAAFLIIIFDFLQFYSQRQAVRPPPPFRKMHRTQLGLHPFFHSLS